MLQVQTIERTTNSDI